MENFLSEILPTSGFYFAVQKGSRGIRHFPCKSIQQLAATLTEIDARGLDAYFACASYAQESYVDSEGKSHYRTAENAELARSFWLDIDCGAAKGEKGNGYSTPDEADNALRLFCEAHRLPIPTTVCSGGGLHCYWVLTEDIGKDSWLPIACMLKDLTAKGPAMLLADPSRTADISSILRPVNTTNRKPERNGAKVVLICEMTPIEFDAFKSAIEAAHQQLSQPGKSAIPAQIPAHLVGRTPLVTGLATEPTVPPQSEMREALAYINPDTPRSEWWPRLAAIADAYGEDGRDLARDWSSGTIQNKAASSFDPGDFEKQYTDALSRKDYSGTKATVGTIIHLAREGGWTTSVSNNTPAISWPEEMNSKYAWIEAETQIFRLEFRDFVTAADLRMQCANKLVSVEAGSGSKFLDKGTLWLKHPKRREHRQVVLRPGESQVTHDNCLNVWAGFAVEPNAGDVKPFAKLIARLVPDKTACMYIVCWLAHLIQKPGVKLHTALVMWSLKQGVGKNLLFECIARIIGSTHATTIGQAELARDFNGWADNKIFIIGDEVSSQDRRQDADKLKGLITSTTLQVNEKHQPARVVENLLNFVFLSNHHNAMFLNGHDRRFHVVEVTADRLPQVDAAEFVKWRDNGGLASLLHALQNFDLSGFDPKAPAPDTDAKKQMIADNLSDLETWAESVMQTGPLIALGREIATSDELAQRYALETGKGLPSTKAVSTAFKKLGARHRVNQVRLAGGKKVRVLALENTAHWENQPEAAWAAEMSKPLGSSSASRPPQVP